MWSEWWTAICCPNFFETKARPADRSEGFAWLSRYLWIDWTLLMMNLARIIISHYKGWKCSRIQKWILQAKHSIRFRRSIKPFYAQNVSLKQGHSWHLCWYPARKFKVSDVLNCPYTWIPTDYVHRVNIGLLVQAVVLQDYKVSWTNKRIVFSSKSALMKLKELFSWKKSFWLFHLNHMRNIWKWSNMYNSCIKKIWINVEGI